MKLKNTLIFSLLILLGCKEDTPLESPVGNPIEFEQLDFRFKELNAEKTGISFQNKIFESDDLNYFTYEYLYNGGGVSIADFDNDGLDDIFFTCNMGFNRLYKNNGGLKFQDVSKPSGIRSSKDWCTGTTIVDINQDGLMDIYVSRSGWFEDANLRSNLLYINKGNFTFEEQAAFYGINDQGYTTQSTFFDADGDGDLDLYVMNHPRVFSESLDDFISKTQNPPAYQSDRFYENENGKYVDASDQWGIQNYGHGLGLVTADFNDDGKIDIYVSNDYQQHDYLYINEGTSFAERSKEKMRHMAKFSMGVDAADFNNDGRIDVMAVEMMPADNYRKKTNMANMNPELYYTFVDNGLQDQEMHNVLQVNEGNDGFTDQAYLRGVAESDWSWAPLFADFDGDLDKDLFISNGYRRDVLNKDISKKIKKSLKKESFKYSEVKDFYKMHLSQNVFYKNDNATFSLKEGAGFNSAFNSNGAAYSDLDNDGDLDIVCNNMESEAVVYENISQPKSATTIRLKTKNDLFGFGARVDVEVGGQTFTYTNTPTRGFQSSVPPYILVPGLKSKDIAEIRVVWSDGKREAFKNFAADEVVLTKGKGRVVGKKKKNVDIVAFEELAYKHSEAGFDDYSIQPLLPYKVSEQGPFSLKANLDGKPGDELFISGSAGQAAQIFSIDHGRLIPSDYGKEALLSQKKYEDSGVCIFDLNNDGLMDVYISRGSYASVRPDQLEDVIYLNTGTGFKVQKSPIRSNSCFPTAIDYDQDGDQDIFVGGGVIPGRYPMGSASYVLENRNGVLTESKVELDQAAFVTGIGKMDVDQDGNDDLVIIGEWSSPVLLKWSDQKWLNISEQYLPAGLMGMWSSLHFADLDQDGKQEILLGNLGLNTKFSASVNAPFKCYSNDFDENGTSEIVLAAFENGEEYPVRGKQCSSEQLPSLQSSIETYDIFAKSDVEDIYGEKLKDGYSFSCEQLASGYLKRNTTGGFEFVDFPLCMQESRIYAFSEAFLDDECPKLLYHGNLDLEVETGKLDAFTFEAIDLCTWKQVDFLNGPKLVYVRSIEPLDKNCTKFVIFQKDASGYILDMTKS